MAQNENVPWDEQTDRFINELDERISDKYGISFRDLILNPNKFATKKDMPLTFQNIRKDVDAYFDDLMDSFKDEKAKLDSELESLTAQYHEIDATITNKAALARVPYIKPKSIERKEEADENVIIDKYEPGMESLIGKLLSNAVYVADVSVPYKNYTLGSWLFSGQKNYLLSLDTPTSIVLNIETSRDVISYLLDTISGVFKA